VDAIAVSGSFPPCNSTSNLPQRFELEYVAEDGTRKQPLMVHRALYGSVERFFGVLIEHYAGAFPAWLSPVQCDDPDFRAPRRLRGPSRGPNSKPWVRVEVDARNEKMNAKISNTPCRRSRPAVVGDKEARRQGERAHPRKEKTEDMGSASSGKDSRN